MMNFNINSALLAILTIFAALNFYEQYQTSREVRKILEWQKSTFQQYQEIQQSQQNATFRQPESPIQRNTTGIADGGYIKKPAPPYPAAAREREEEGNVTIEVIVNEFGQVESTRLVKSSGSPRLDWAAQNAAGQSNYKPKSQQGTPIKTRFITVYTFKLDD